MNQKLISVILSLTIVSLSMAACPEAMCGKCMLVDSKKSCTICNKSQLEVESKDSKIYTCKAVVPAKRTVVGCQEFKLNGSATKCENCDNSQGFFSKSSEKLNIQKCLSCGIKATFFNELTNKCKDRTPISKTNCDRPEYFKDAC